MNGARLRTLIVAAGFGFTGAALASACLDFAGEDWGVCASPAATGSTGTGADAGASAPTIDCGTLLVFPDSSQGSGSGSAARP